MRSALSLPPHASTLPPRRSRRSAGARMRRYRLADALHWPSLLSAARVPLGLGFVLAIRSPIAAIALLAAAALTDVLDGWLARRLRQQNATGALIDGVADKVFVACVAVALVASGNLGALGLLALATREIGELALLAWYLLSHARRREGAPLPAADGLGKATTCAQFVAVVLAIVGARPLPYALAIAGVLGCVAAAHYVRREIARLLPARAGSRR